MPGEKSGNEMALLEVLVVAVGRQVAAAAARAMFNDSDVARSAGDLVESHLGEYLEKRRAARQLDGVAEDVAEKLKALVAAEFKGLQEYEARAAIEAVGETLQAASISPELLAKLDMSPARLEAHAHRQGREILRRRLLSDAAGQLYSIVLSESCHYITGICSSLSGMQPAAIKEILTRQGALHFEVNSILEALPGHGFQSGNEDGEFELKYRREVVAKLDRLQLFGLSTEIGRRKYALSVAYISLSVSTEAPDGGSDDDGEVDQNVATRVDIALAGNQRTLVRGEAGSGKTTLLQWLAVRSARGEFEGELEDWNDNVPLFIRLRSYADRRLPKPEEFLEESVPSLSGAMPDGWVHRILDSGRGMVLVDGIDELPEEQREDVREWLEELTRVYPDSRYVMTSRPPAVEDGWLTLEGLSDAELQPMTQSDISSFIDHWHAAARAGDFGSELEQGEVDYASDLKTVIRQNASLRGLATLPLLCAMMCALHRERRAQLPSDRMQLYAIALDMLLERRDVERRIPAGTSTELTRAQKDILLRRLALWLLLNGQSDAEKGRAVEQVRHELASMGTVTAPAEQVFDGLLLRSGLLREPVEGRVDFLHRTFQEYLAAHGIIENDLIERLIASAHLDSWREVVVLAVGHARPHEREQILRQLIERGENEDEFRHRLHLLAIACMETAPQLSPEVTEELTERLTELLPPRNMTDAGAVASAGELAVPMLQKFHKGELATTAAACVRSLVNIGTESALQALESYANDMRVTVSRELIRGWDAFDSEQYARRVLAKSPLLRGNLTVEDSSRIEHLQFLEHLDALTCNLWALPSLEPLRGVDALQRLWVRGGGFESLAALEGAPRLSQISLLGCAQLVDLTDVSTLPSIVGLNVQSSPALPSVSLGVPPPPRLRSLLFGNLPQAAGWEDLAGLTSLRKLEIYLAPHLRSIEWMENLNELEHLAMGSVGDMTTLFGLPSAKLRSLRCSDNDALIDISAVGSAQQLAELDLEGCGSLSDLTPLASLRNLESLDLSNCSSIATLDGLEGLEKLDHLDVASCDGLVDISPIEKMPKLQVLVIAGCDNLSSDSWRAIASLRGAIIAMEDAQGRSQDLPPAFWERNEVQVVHRYTLPDGTPGRGRRFYWTSRQRSRVVRL